MSHALRLTIPPLLAAVLTACSVAPAATEGTEPVDRPVRSVGQLSTVPPSSDPPVVGEVPADLRAQVVADAAERSAVDPSAVETIRAESVTWPDGSLGCPEPGMLYTQALVDGYRVVVRAGDDELDYRLTGTGVMQLCEGAGPPGSKP